MRLALAEAHAAEAAGEVPVGALSSSPPAAKSSRSGNNGVLRTADSHRPRRNRRSFARPVIALE